MENKDIVLFEKKEDIAFVTFNRPEAMNALSTKVNIRLGEILDMAEMEETVKVVILTGAGEKAFVAGGDIMEMMDLDALGARGYAIQAKRAVDKIYGLHKPVIAAINSDIKPPLLVVDPERFYRSGERFFLSPAFNA